MDKNTDLYIVILAGGTGRRLWPVSRKGYPKQFIDIFGTGETMLQTAADRARKVVGDSNVLVVTSHQFGNLVTEQLPWLPSGHLLVEPLHRNTAPSAAWAVHRIMCETGNEDSAVVLMPADQTILHADRFAEAVRHGADFVRNHDTVMCFGATPTRTEPGYGYIQVSPASLINGGGPSAEGSNGIGTVKSFIEKPDREFAKVLIESGEFLWNTGIYMTRVGHFRKQMKALLPTVLRNERTTVEEENRFINENYSRYPNLSLDLAILEKMASRSVMHCDFGWTDIGTWHGLYESMPKNADDNVIVNSRSTVIADNSHRNVVTLEDGRLAVLSSMDGYIVAEKGNVLLICPKTDNSAAIRKYLALVENDETLSEAYE